MFHSFTTPGGEVTYKIEGVVVKVHGEDWLIVAELEGGFCLAIRDGEAMPARVHLVYCLETLARKKVSEVTL